VEFVGFTIAEYDVQTGQAQDNTSIFQKSYQKGPFQMEYNAQKYIYRLFVKVKADMPDRPSIIAIMYRDTDKTDNSYVLPLGFPSKEGGEAPSQMLYKEYMADKSNSFPTLRRYQVPMNHDPNPKLPYYYGFLQFNYHYPDQWYQSGPLFIEVNIGIGIEKRNVPSWLPPETFQWNISNYISPFVGREISDVVKPEPKEPEKIQTSSELTDVTKPQSDNPIDKPYYDFLGSTGFAKYLAVRIKQIYNSDVRSTDTKSSGHLFMVHIYGSWGSGKTSLLNILGKSLEGTLDNETQESNVPNNQKKQENNHWKVVWFNAWREQHRNPPWWAIMDKIFQDTKKDIEITSKISEYFYRLNSKSTYLIAGVLTFAAIALISYIIHLTFPNESFLRGFADEVNPISTTLTILTTIAGIFYVLVSNLMPDSSLTTMKQDEISKKEREKVKDRIKQIVSTASISHPIALFIDDLDRCDASYVVALLEGIQTLFMETPLVIVIAADRRWLYASYKAVYKKFSNGVKEPGRPMEHLFIEKAFQMSVPMPSLTLELQKDYLKFLLETKPEEKDWKELDSQARTKANSEIIRKGLQWDLLDDKTINEIEQSFSNDYEKRIFRQEAIVQIAKTTSLEEMKHEHRLLLFAPCLESNPRAMKRFINSWDINKNLNILLKLNIDPNRLALWTILMMRWPLLARYLHDYPQKIGLIGNLNETNKSEINEEYQELFNDEIVKKVTKDLNLNEDILMRCTALCA